MPFGAQIRLVKNGFKRWTSACGHHVKNHIEIEGSGPIPMYAVAKMTEQRAPEDDERERQVDRKRKQAVPIGRITRLRGVGRVLGLHSGGDCPSP